MRPMPELKVEEIPTDELIEYRMNSKLHPHTQIDQIADSISTFGFNTPILAWHNDEGEPEIIAGHGRLLAARKLGLEQLPVVFLDHLDDKSRRAFSHIENKLNLNSGFDFEILDQELEELGADFDFEAFGFDALPEVDIDSFFEEETVEKGSAPKTVTCPHCGEEFEL